MPNIIVNSEQVARIAKAFARFSPSWESLSDKQRATAIKVTILCELVGGRSKTFHLLGVKDNTVDNYRHGNTEPSYSDLEILADKAGVLRQHLTKYWSFEDGIVRIISDDTESGLRAEVTEEPVKRNSISDNPPFAYQPGYDEVIYSQGGFAEAGNQQVSIPNAFWEKLNVDPRNILVFFGKGDGMSPQIPDGAPVFVDVSDRDLTDGCIYLLSLGDDVIIRRVQKLVDGSVELLSTNPSLFPAQHIRKSNLVDLKVVGRVRSGNWIA